jgi:hypothetical protein
MTLKLQTVSERKHLGKARFFPLSIRSCRNYPQRIYYIIKKSKDAEP